MDWKRIFGSSSVSGDATVTSTPTARRLISLNPWVEPFINDLIHLNIPAAAELPTNAVSNSFQQARRAQTLQRISQGNANWNTWAHEMRKIRQSLTKDSGSANLWSVLAAVDLTDENITYSFDAAAMVFPGAVNFSNTVFGQYAWFNHATFEGPATFKTVRFGSEANFEHATFRSLVNFAGAQFHKTAEFRKVIAESGISFEFAEFSKDAWFIGSRFKGSADFNNARFAGEAGLDACHYIADANFSATQFGDNAGFEEAEFDGSIDFNDAIFSRNARFSRAIFRTSASFNRTIFLGAKYIDNIKSVPMFKM